MRNPASRSQRTLLYGNGRYLSRLVLVVAASLAMNFALAAPPKKGQKKQNSATKAYLPNDVLATVNGEKITRREFTTFWLKVDNQAFRPLGIMLLDRINGSHAVNRTQIGGLAPSYSITEIDIYKQLYTLPATEYSTFLSNMVTSRLLAQEANRKGIVVTRAEAESEGRALLKEARAQQKVLNSLTDDEILSKFRVPRDLFLDQMVFRLRSERLFAQAIADRNGHPIGPDDWISLRQLFAGANIGTDPKKNEMEFKEAHDRVVKWAEEVKSGKKFAEVASAHNEDGTRNDGGLRGPALLGTGSREIELAVLKLKPGEMSPPLRGTDGWYIFLMERRGVQLSMSERAQLWKSITEKRLPAFLLELRKQAKITSAVPLPNDTLSTPGTVTNGH